MKTDIDNQRKMCSEPDKWDRVFAEKLPVVLLHDKKHEQAGIGNKAGFPLYWILVLESEEGFWIDAFKTEKQARRFAKKHGLPIVAVLEI
jgi:hypothetical protein